MCRDYSACALRRFRWPARYHLYGLSWRLAYVVSLYLRGAHEEEKTFVWETIQALLMLARKPE
jgi:hypothetical protein